MRNRVVAAFNQQVFILTLSCLLSCAIKVPRQTIATVIELHENYGTGKGKGPPAAVYEYNVEGKTHTIRRATDKYCQIGEKFNMVYDSLKEDRVKFLMPVFLSGEKTSHTNGVIINWEGEGYLSYFTYTYSVEGQMYKRDQKYFTDQKYLGEQRIMARDTLKKRVLFDVEYLNENPKRAVLHPEKPILQ